MMDQRINLLFDMRNLMYRPFKGYLNSDTAEVACAMSIASTMEKFWGYYQKAKKKFKTENVRVYAVFDGRNNWRKQYTKGGVKCVTRKPYKGQRRVDLTSKEQRDLEMFDEYVTAFHDLLHSSTSIITLFHDHLEADDLIAGITMTFPDENHWVISNDKDFIQLMRNPNVQLPEREDALDEYDGDAEYFMFEKQFRGDTGDNVQSAYPRLRKTKIKAAYQDEFVFQNLMEHQFVVPMYIGDTDELEDVTYTTRELFKENKLLMDLSAQPNWVKKEMVKTIERSIRDRGHFNRIQYVRMCRALQLIRLGDASAKMTPLLKGVA